MNLKTILSAILLACGTIASAGPENPQALLDNYRRLSDICEAAGDMENAYRYARMYSSLQDSIWAAKAAEELELYYQSFKDRRLEDEAAAMRLQQSQMLIKSLSAQKAMVQLENEQDSISMENLQASYDRQRMLLLLESKDNQIREEEYRSAQAKHRYTRTIGYGILSILLISGILVAVLAYQTMRKSRFILKEKQKAEEAKAAAQEVNKARNRAVSYMNKMIQRPVGDVFFFSRTLNSDEPMTPELKKGMLNHMKEAIDDLITVISEGLSNVMTAGGIFIALFLASGVDASAQTIPEGVMDNETMAYYLKCDSKVSADEVVAMCDTLREMGRRKGDQLAQVLSYHVLMGHAYLKHDLPYMERVAEDAITYIRTTPYKEYIFHVRNRLVLYHMRNEDYTRALKETKEYQDDAVHYRVPYGISRSYYYTGDILQRRGLYDEAVEQYLAGIEYLRQHNALQNDNTVTSYTKIGEIRQIQGNLKAAEESFLKGREVAQKGYQEMTVLLKMLEFYSTTGQKEKAESVKIDADNYMNSGQIVDYRVDDYNNSMALFYSMKGDLEKAREYVEKLGDSYYDTQEKFYASTGEYGKALENLRKLDKQKASAQEKLSSMRMAAMQADWQNKFQETINMNERASNNQLQVDIIKNEMQLSMMRHQRDSMNLIAEQMRYDRQKDSVSLMEKDKIHREEQIESARYRNRQTRMTFILITAFFFLIIVSGITYVASTTILNRTLEEEKDAAEKAAKDAEEASEQKRDFIKHISHEIRTPLNAIQGFNELIHTPGYEEIVDKDSFREVIALNTDSLKTMVDEIHIYSAILANNITPTPEIIEVKQLFDEIAEDYEGRTKPGVRITCNAGNMKVWADRKYLSTALRVMMDNACKFTESGSIDLSCTHDNGDVNIILTDTGTGIAGDFAMQMFNSFSKANQFVPGLGLGLSIALKLVHRMGGTIKYIEEYTEGTRLMISLPE